VGEYVIIYRPEGEDVLILHVLRAVVTSKRYCGGNGRKVLRRSSRSAMNLLRRLFV
jgi:hypothetical protein